MFIEPLQLIDETIEHLETLDTLFADEIEGRTLTPAQLTLETRLCLDAKVAISALLPRLRAARATQLSSHAPNQLCLNCD